MNKQAILRKITRNDKDCWMYPDGSGAYPRVRGEYVHHMTYKLWIGPIPFGCDLDHTCGSAGKRGTGNRCVNPYHLKPIDRSHHNRLTFRRRRGQMERKQLRIARWLHNEVGRH